jgi:hypothetical protein
MGGPCSDCCFAACTRSTQEPPRKVEPDLRMNLRTRSENPAQLTLRALVGSEPPPVASQDGHSRTHPRRSCSGSSARWRARNAGRPVIASIHIEAVQQRVFANSVELGKPTLELERLARRSDLDIQGTPRRGRFQEIDPDQRLMWSWGDAVSERLAPAESGSRSSFARRTEARGCNSCITISPTPSVTPTGVGGRSSSGAAPRSASHSRGISGRPGCLSPAGTGRPRCNRTGVEPAWRWRCSRQWPAATSR